MAVTPDMTEKRGPAQPPVDVVYVGPKGETTLEGIGTVKRLVAFKVPAERAAKLLAATSGLFAVPGSEKVKALEAKLAADAGETR